MFLILLQGLCVIPVARAILNLHLFILLRYQRFCVVRDILRIVDIYFGTHIKLYILDPW